jgi:ABC-2 type transport system permease protein
MTALSLTVSDSATMLRRQFRHWLRYPSLTVQIAGFPIVFLLLFVYVFGGTLGDGLGGAEGGRAAYVNYVTPGILMMAVAAGTTSTAISVAMDMTEGIVARFRTMAIARVSVLTGHVVGSVLQIMLIMVLVVLTALLVGFRPGATAVEWLARSECSPSPSSRPATYRSRWCSCRSSAAGSCPPSRCRPCCAGSPTISRSRRSSRHCGDC